MADVTGVAAGDGCPGYIVRGIIRRYGWQQGQARHSPDQRFQLRRGRLHQVRPYTPGRPYGYFSDMIVGNSWTRRRRMRRSRLLQSINLDVMGDRSRRGEGLLVRVQCKAGVQ